MTIVVLEGAEHVGASGAKIERKKRRIRTSHKSSYAEIRVLAEPQVCRKDESSEEYSGVGVSHIKLTYTGPVPVDVHIRPK